MEATNVKFCTKTIKDSILTISINRKVAVQRKLTDYPEAVREQAMQHGFSQKLGDSVASLSKGNKESEAIKTVQDLDAQLMAGMWNRPSGPVGPKEVFPLADLVEGLFGALKKTPEGKATQVEQVQAMLEGMDVSGRNEVAKNAAVRAEVLAVQTRRAQAEAKKEPSLGDLLSKLGKVA